MDDTYQIYVNRVARLTLPASYQSQLTNIQSSPKFEKGKPLPFPGYSIITPPASQDSTNQKLYAHLSEIQQELLALFGSSLNPVPPASFHLTIADLIWDARYQEAIAENSSFERELKTCIQTSFEQYHASGNNSGVVQWQILGLLVFPRALGVALVPRTEADYLPVLELRRLLYQNPDLMTLGIEQQYNFTGHITLGYFGDSPSLGDEGGINSKLGQLNDRWLELEPQILEINQVEFRYFKDMTDFQRQPDYPAVALTS